VLSHLFPEALKEKTQRGHLPLHLAAQSQVKESVVEALIAAYPEAAQVKNHSSNTPLHDASKYKASPGVVRLLLDTYPDAVYIQNQYGNLPLHCATAYQAPAEVVQLLLAAWPDGAAMQNRNKVSMLMANFSFSRLLRRLTHTRARALVSLSRRMHRYITPLRTRHRLMFYDH
jgi:ankyrin repeat protein